MSTWEAKAAPEPKEACVAAYQQAWEALEKKEYAHAKASLGPWLKAYPLDERAWHLLGVASYLAGDFDQAGDAELRLVDILPNHAEGWSGACLARVMGRKWTEALPHCERAVVLDPMSLGYRIQLGQVLLLNGQDSRAEGEYARVLAFLDRDRFEDEVLGSLDELVSHKWRAAEAMRLKRQLISRWESAEVVDLRRRIQLVKGPIAKEEELTSAQKIHALEQRMRSMKGLWREAYGPDVFLPGSDERIERFVGLFKGMNVARILDLSQRDVAQLTATFGPNHPYLVEALVSLSDLAERAGDYALAIEAGEQAYRLTLLEGTAQYSEAVALRTRIAGWFMRVGQFDRAEALLTSRSTVDTAHCPLAFDESPLVHQGRAEMRMRLGDLEGAASLADALLATREAGTGESRTSGEQLILLYRLSGQHAQELQAIDQYMRESDVVPNSAQAIMNLPFEARRLELMEQLRDPNVLDEARKALGRMERMLGRQHFELGGVLLTMARHQMRLGAPDLAESLLLRGAALTATAPAAWDTRWRIQDTLRSMYQSAGLLDLSILWGKQAVNTVQSTRGQMTGIDGQLQALFLDQARVAYEGLADVLVADGRILEGQSVLQMLKEHELYQGVERGSTRDMRAVQQELTGLERARYGGYYELRDRQLALAQERGELESKRRAGLLTRVEEARLEDIATKLYPQIIDAMQRFFAGLQQEIASERRSTSQADYDVSGRQNLLRSAVRDLARAEPRARAVGLQFVLTSSRLSIILTVPDGPPLARQVVVDRREVARLIARVGTQLRDPTVDLSLVQRSLAELHEILIAPIAADLNKAGAQTLMVSATDVLRYIPFAALFDGKRYLLQDYTVSIFNEAAGQTMSAGGARSWWVASLGLSEPVEGLPALKAVPAEISAVVSAASGEQHLNAAFDRRRLMSALAADFNALHLASHFVFESGRPAQSRLYLGDKSRLTIQDITQQDLRFDNFDLVTLSACETALAEGRDGYGQEMESLGAKAQKQGAKAVMASLWKVDDESTASLMQRFYAALVAGGANKAQALRAAQLALLSGDVRRSARQSWQHPYYWAPFVLMGNWR